MESQQSQDSSRQFLSFQSLLEQPQSHSMGGICHSAGNAVGRVDRRVNKQHIPLRLQPYRMQAGCSQQRQQQELLTATHHAAQASTQSQQQHQEQQRLLALLLQQQSPPPAAQPTTTLAQEQPQQQQQQPLHAQERIVFRRELAVLLNGMTFQQAAYLKDLLRQHLQLAQQDRQQQQQQQPGRAVLCRVRCLQLMRLYSSELKAGRFQIPGRQQASQLLLQQQQGSVGKVLEVVPAGPLCAWLDRECEIRQLSRLYARLAAATVEAGGAQQQQQQQWVTPLLRQSAQLTAFVGQLLRQKTWQQAASLTESVLAALESTGPCRSPRSVADHPLRPATTDHCLGEPPQQLGRTGSVLQQLLLQGQPGMLPLPQQQEVLLPLARPQHLAAARAGGLQEPEPAAAGTTLDQLMAEPATVATTLDQRVAEAVAICRDPNSTLGEIILGLYAALEECVRVERACTKAAAATVAAAAAITDAELDVWTEAAAAAETDRGAALAILQHPQLRQAASMQRCSSVWQMAAAAAAAPAGSECGSCSVDGDDVDDSADTAGCK